MRSVAIGERIDCRDTIGRWYRATLVATIQTQRDTMRCSNDPGRWYRATKTSIILEATKSESQGVCASQEGCATMMLTTRSSETTIRSTTNQSQVRVSYEGWPSTYDEWIENESERLAPVATHLNTRSLFQPGDRVEIGDWTQGGRGREAYGSVVDVRQLGAHKLVTLDCIQRIPTGPPISVFDRGTVRYDQSAEHRPKDLRCQCVECHIRFLSEHVSP